MEPRYPHFGCRSVTVRFMMCLPTSTNSMLLLKGRFDSLTPFTHGHERVLMAGADVYEPEEKLPIMIDKFDHSGKEPFTARFAVPSDFEVLVAKRTNRPVIQGELNPVFQGVYSSRIDVKQAIRKFGTVADQRRKTGRHGKRFGSRSKSRTNRRSMGAPLIQRDA